MPTHRAKVIGASGRELMVHCFDARIWAHPEIDRDGRIVPDLRLIVQARKAPTTTTTISRRIRYACGLLDSDYPLWLRGSFKVTWARHREKPSLSIYKYGVTRSVFASLTVMSNDGFLTPRSIPEM